MTLKMHLLFGIRLKQRLPQDVFKYDTCSLALLTSCFLWFNPSVFDTFAPVVFRSLSIDLPAWFWSRFHLLFCLHRHLMLATILMTTFQRLGHSAETSRVGNDFFFLSFFFSFPLFSSSGDMTLKEEQKKKNREGKWTVKVD